MVRCVSCGASSSADIGVCLECGAQVTRVDNAKSSIPPGPRRSSVPSMPAVAVTPSCSNCDAVGSDDGNGYCSQCGQKLGGGLSLSLIPTAPPEPSAPEPGAMIGDFRVDRSSSRADAIATSATLGEALVALGDPIQLACEAAALDVFASAGAEARVAVRLPRVLAEALDAEPPHLALSAPTGSAKKLWDVAVDLLPHRAFDLVELLLEDLRRIERAGFAFVPAPTDFLIDGDTLGLARLRGARRLGSGERIDAKAIVDALGECFLPEPAVRAVPRFVRAIAPTRETYEGKKPSLDDIAGEIAVARRELDEALPSGTIAELTDPGLWRPYQQDATAIAEGIAANGSRWKILVVCDGVSSSPMSGKASRGAAKAACEALVHFARSPDLAVERPEAAVEQAIRAAHLVVCTSHYADPSPTPPGTTIVAALVHDDRATIGWVGDSRAYWCGKSGPEALTRDHSWVNEALARGEIQSEDEVEGALAHTITKCLGPLEVGNVPIEIEPDVVSRKLDGEGSLMLCTDGLWNYAPKLGDLEIVLRAAGNASAAGLARFLVSYALARGGQDNVSVAVYRHGEPR